MTVEIIRRSYLYKSHINANAYRCVGYWVVVDGKMVTDNYLTLRQKDGFTKREAEMIKRNIEKGIWSYGRNKTGLALAIEELPRFLRRF